MGNTSPLQHPSPAGGIPSVAPCRFMDSPRAPPLPRVNGTPFMCPSCLPTVSAKDDMGSDASAGRSPSAYGEGGGGWVCEGTSRSARLSQF